MSQVCMANVTQIWQAKTMSCYFRATETGAPQGPNADLLCRDTDKTEQKTGHQREIRVHTVSRTAEWQANHLPIFNSSTLWSLEVRYTVVWTGPTSWLVLIEQ